MQVNVITSLAGRTGNPAPVAGRMRVGGFGGTKGLADYLAGQNIALVIDATHPYAIRISRNAADAAMASHVPLVRLERPTWQKQTGDNWTEVEDEAAAMQAIPCNARVLLALGRQHIAPFAARSDAHFVMRMIDAAETALPHRHELILAKPGGYDEERRFLCEKHIGLIVCRNSGGEASYAKIKAARDLALPVIMIARPPMIAGNVVSTLEDVIGVVSLHLAP